MVIFMNTELRSLTSGLVTVGLLSVIDIIISIAMFLQIFNNELPCELCHLQRISFLVIAFACSLQFNDDCKNAKNKSTGIILLFSCVLMTIGIRQSLLDICPRPGHEWIGSAILHLHMPLWSIIIGMGFIITISMDYMLLQSSNNKSIQAYPLLYKLGKGLSYYCMILVVFNLVAAFIQCGLGQCHTAGYRLLSSS